MICLRVYCKILTRLIIHYPDYMVNISIIYPFLTYYLVNVCISYGCPDLDGWKHVKNHDYTINQIIISPKSPGLFTPSLYSYHFGCTPNYHCTHQSHIRWFKIYHPLLYHYFPLKGARWWHEIHMAVEAELLCPIKWVQVNIPHISPYIIYIYHILCIYPHSNVWFMVWCHLHRSFKRRYVTIRVAVVSPSGALAEQHSGRWKATPSGDEQHPYFCVSDGFDSLEPSQRQLVVFFVR